MVKTTPPMRAVILFSLVALANALDLAPVIFHPPIINEFEFSVPLQSTTESIMKLINFRDNTFAPSIGDKLQSIAAAITGACGFEHAEIKHITWKFEIESHAGTLTAFDITTTINKNHVHILSKSIRLIQKLPDVYERFEHVNRNCGKKKYGIVGECKKEIWYTYRNHPNDHELKIISDRLYDQLPNARNLIVSVKN
ncbi:MAG: hypothetical protein Hyperionvirus6_68 [Hyperionvirus sp.]|uniref:Uncharacterized protein n=1 Tax=Hyperionvirus sp. TaxID=2487770 RepID=A0A3G5A7Z8_9VIRU|nr:MAG: hypothetical protein Hyperionvirus6_68 [Hyperionvirus sp.]